MLIVNWIISASLFLGFISEPEYGDSFTIPTIALQVTLSNAAPKAGDEITVTIKSEIPKDWYVYSSNIDCEIGPLPPEFNITNTNVASVLGNLQSVNDSIYEDDIFECQVGAFKKQVYLTQKITVLSKDEPLTFSCVVQMCSNVSGICVPKVQHFSIPLK